MERIGIRFLTSQILQYIELLQTLPWYVPHSSDFFFFFFFKILKTSFVISIIPDATFSKHKQNQNLKTYNFFLYTQNEKKKKQNFTFSFSPVSFSLPRYSLGLIIWVSECVIDTEIAERT